MLESKVTALEGGAMGVVTASGMSAQLLALTTICKCGDTIVSSPQLYGGTANQFKVLFPRFGIKVKFTEGITAEDFAKVVEGDDTVKAVYAETAGNPGYNIPDFEGISALAKKVGVPFVVDNTFGCAGALCRPLKHGADIVVQSLTKWAGGHGTTIGGMVVDGGSFPWNNGKFPEFTEPSAGYHGLKFWDTFGPDGPLKANVAFAIRARVEGLRDMGMAQTPIGAYLLNMGLETLSLRVERHSANAEKLAVWLKEHPNVSWVSHQSLPEHPSHEDAKKYYTEGLYSPMLAFGVKGGTEASRLFIDKVKLASHVANVGDAKTLVIAPAITTHEQLTDDEQAAAGVTKDMVRVSCGIEHIEDIKADFQQALEIAAAGVAGNEKEGTAGAAAGGGGEEATS